MAQRPNIPKRKSGKPSRLLMLCALVIACSLPYVLVKNFAHPKKNEETNQSLILPALIKDSPLVIEKPASPITLDKPAPNKTISNISITSAASPTTATIAIKTAKPAPKKKDNEWQTVKPRSGDSMAAIFHRLGLSAKNLHEVLQKNPHAKVLTAIKPSQELKFLINKQKLEKLIIPVNYVQTLTIYRAGAVYKSQIESKKTVSHDQFITATVKGSLYTTAQRMNIPSKLIQQMTEILNKEVDFTHSIRSGDQFSIVYDGYFIGDKRVGTGDIVAVSFTNRGNTVQAIRHINRQGDKNYYTPQGNSLKKAFSRYPIKFSHISSTFTLSRYHPILHYKRAHKGIDLAAPIGTPIQATGDGIITVIDRHNGYGNMIKIKHDKKYSTIYGHMLKFQKGLSKGSKVKRGQVIGYVGQTGLATGPHCHYELHVNNQPKNPTTAGLPTAAPVPSRELAGFRAKSGNLFARLKIFESATIASKGKRTSKIG
ncbi:MAG: peptidoglycan DD-metalloendopeptidase family protein [bacterium]|nr:peptidoglycan DD-metalloendopeptidase family protein [bacterium]